MTSLIKICNKFKCKVVQVSLFVLNVIEKCQRNKKRESSPSYQEMLRAKVLLAQKRVAQ